MFRLMMWVVAVMLASLVAFSPGCAKPMTAQEVAATKQGIVDQRAQLDAAKGTVTAERDAALAVADVDKAQKLGESLATIARLQMIADKALVVLNAATRPDGTIDSGSALGAAMPIVATAAPAFGPVGIAVASGLGLITALVGVWGKRQSNIAAGVVNSIDTAKAGDPELARAMTKNGAVIGAALKKTKGAHAFVEKHRVKSTADKPRPTA